MQTEQLDLGGIPALVWGPPGDGAVVAVHGNLSHKADTPIQLLAEAASARALQVLSFDLPGHGGRQDEPAMADGKPLSRRHIQTEQEERAWQWKKSQKTESPSPL